MTSIFISHSSQDKPFVRRLALDLIDRDFSVWLDDWNLETGTSLAQAIEQGISGQRYFLVVLSKSVVGSEWVAREIELALRAELSAGRSMVLPIRIDECEIPGAIADRLFADFSQGYNEPLHELTEQLQRVVGESEAFERPVVALFSTKGVDLDGARLQRRLDRLRDRVGTQFSVSASDLKVTPEPGYDTLRQQMLHRLDHIDTDPYYSPEFASDFQSRCDSVLRLERKLIRIIASLITERGVHDWPGAWTTGEVCEWYWRIARTHLIGWMYQAQNPDGPIAEFGEDCMRAIMSRNTMASIYRVEDTTSVHVIARERDEFYSVEIPADSHAARTLTEEPYSGPDALGHFDSGLLTKWVMPQALYYERDFSNWRMTAHGLTIGLR